MQRRFSSEQQQAKYQKLEKALASMERVVVAYSGGVDSTLLLTAAADALKGNVLALTAISKLFPARETDEAGAFCKSLGIRHAFFDVSVLDNPSFKDNPPERCYICKLAIFQTLADVAAAHGFEDATIIEGSNTDDLSDYRPGRRALEELGIASPLLDAGLSKEDIRSLSRDLALPTWDKPSFACLASRIEYGEELNDAKLALVGSAEQYLIDRGFSQVRVRLHGTTARIELPADTFDRFMANGNPQEVDNALRSMGFDFVTLDLGGYESGKMNRLLADAEQ